MLITGSSQAICSQQKLLAGTFLSMSVACEQVVCYKQFVSNCDVCTRKNSRATRKHERVKYFSRKPAVNGLVLLNNVIPVFKKAKSLIIKPTVIF